MLRNPLATIAAATIMVTAFAIAPALAQGLDLTMLTSLFFGGRRAARQTL